MKLIDLHSAELLPEFAQAIAWAQDGFDLCTRAAASRIVAVDAPSTLEAIHALTDNEIEAYYAQYGVAEYYPDLSRETREKMLYWMARLYRYLGTPRAIEILCRYIFDGAPLNVVVHDNLAFDEYGHLIDSTLLDVFDIEVLPTGETLPANATQRILDNVIAFSRNSQSLRDIYYTTPDNEIPCSVQFTRPFDGVDAVVYETNDAVCQPTVSYGFVEIPQQSLDEISQPHTFKYIPPVPLDTFAKLFTFIGISQPFSTFARVDTFELMLQPSLGFVDIS